VHDCVVYLQLVVPITVCCVNSSDCETFLTKIASSVSITSLPRNFFYSYLQWRIQKFRLGRGGGISGGGVEPLTNSFATLSVSGLLVAWVDHSYGLFVPWTIELFTELHGDILSDLLNY